MAETVTESKYQEAIRSAGRIEIGVVGGFLSAVTMGAAIIVVTALGLMPVPFFVALGTLIGSAGIPFEVAVGGFVAYIIIEIVWGLIYAFGFRKYSVMSGLGLGGLKLLIAGVVATVVPIPQLQGTLLTAPFSSVLLLLASLAIVEGVWGATMGAVGKQFAS